MTRLAEPHEDDLCVQRIGGPRRSRPEGGTVSDLFDRDEWHEVPQVIFLSWPLATQLAYCAARDEYASEVVASSDREELWFLERAAAYRRDLKELT